MRLETGNGLITDYSYNADDRRLARLVAGRAGARPFQNLAYGYDVVGNVVTLKNQVPVPRANQYGGPVNQAFGYDDLYRLTSAAGNWTYAPNRQDTYSLAMAYDAVHNITAKTQAHQQVPPAANRWKYRYSQTTTREGVVAGLDKLAVMMKRYGHSALSGDPRLFAALESERKTWSEEYALDVLVDQLRPRAEEAFKKEDYAKAVELYSRIRARLSSTELRKLRMAEDRCKGQQ